MKESHRLDDLGSSNLGAGWTSRKQGFSTMITSKGDSCIQTAHNLRRFKLIDKEDQPVVGSRIKEGDGITREIGWMAVRDKGSLTHFERADGKIVKIKSAGQLRHQVKSTIITQNGAQPSCKKPTVHQENEQQQSCSRLQNLATDLDKCVVDRPNSLIQGDETITLESVHQAEAAGASSTWRGKR